MNKKCSLLFAFILLSISFCSAQNNVSVNTFNGAANVSIPFFTITSGEINVPVGLSYSTSGVRPKDMEGTVGMGWNLEAGGSIRRVVRGIPDDMKKDSAGNTLLGWMYNTNQATITAHTFTNDGTTCSKETADISFITSNFSNLYDTEPDLFYVNAPGLSLKMVYDQTAAKFRPVPYQDVAITYTTDATTGLITSFTIVNDKGVKYLFHGIEKVVESTDLTGNSSGVVNYFKNRYSQYLHTIRYNDAWLITAIGDYTGNIVGVTDTMIATRQSTDRVRLFLAGATNASLQYNIRKTVYQEVPVHVVNAYATNTNDPQLTFKWEGDCLSQMIGQGDTIKFSVNPARYVNGTDTTYKYFLHTITDLGCGSPINYSFVYAGETAVYDPVHGHYNYTTTLSDSLSKKWDYWGYNSSVKDSIPALYVDTASAIGYPRYAIKVAASGGTNYPYTIGYTGSSMGADTTSVMAGALTTINNAYGGTTTIKYQSNDYMDVPSGTLIKGGGIRVKQVVDYDGLDSTKNIIHNYSYINPSTGNSSGKPVSLPAYGFTIPYTGGNTGAALWASSSAISDVDLSPENHSIVYEYCRERQTNAGSTLYQYFVPATNWDASATPDCSGCSTAEWAPTYNYMGRTSCASSYGKVKNDYYSYPFIPNPNYDFERGILKQVTAYTDAGTEVSESDYTYQRSYSSPTAIAALKFDYNTGTTGVMGYNKYNIWTSTSELASQVTKKVYDLALSHYQQDTVKYYYLSANHKLVTKQTATNSDGSILISNINYTKDFAADSGSNANVTAIYKLKQQNINIPVETWSQVQIGATAYTTKASLSLFALAQSAAPIPKYYVPSQSFVFTSPDGVTDFAPFAVSGQTTTKYSGYPGVAANYTLYDYAGALQTADDGHHHKSTSLKDYVSQEPALNATNTASNNIAFADFDSSISSPFSVFTSTDSTFVNGHVGKGIVFKTTDTLSATALTKDSLAGNYIFSIWINSGISGSLSLTITPTSGTAHTYTESFASTGGAWKYFEWKIPVTSFSGAFTPRILVTGGTIDIDDVLLYPETAEVTTYGHDPLTHYANATTNTNGITTYYIVDKWGRMQYAYDRDKNILKKNTYVMPADIKNFKGAGTLDAGPDPNVEHGGYDTNTPIIISTNNRTPCDLAATTFTWYFGDGTSALTTTPESPGHIYPDSGTYVTGLTLSSPVFGVFHTTGSVHVDAGKVDLSYHTNATSKGDLDKVELYNLDGTLAYTIVPSDMSTIKPLKYRYNCVVTMTSRSVQYNPTTNEGYNSVTTSGTNNNYCADFLSSGVYSFSLDLRQCNSLQFVVQITTCSSGGGGH